MNESSQATLASILKLLNAGVATPADAVLSAYRLGKFDGMLEMAQRGQEQVEELLRKAA